MAFDIVNVSPSALKIGSVDGVEDNGVSPAAAARSAPTLVGRALSTEPLLDLAVGLLLDLVVGLLLDFAQTVGDGDLLLG